MPPANSRNNSPPATLTSRSGTPPSYLSALRQLESPVSSSVLNLASTLTTTSAEDDVAAENLNFLRSPIDPQEEWRAENARERLMRTAEMRGEDRERRERLQRVLNRLSRIQESSPAYSDRIPSQNQLYNWSPAANDHEDETELEQILHELRQQQPNTHPEILRVLGRSQLDAERESTNGAYSSRLHSHRDSGRRSAGAGTSNGTAQPGDSSSRTSALLQSVRRHPRLSTRSREYMERYIADRDTMYRQMMEANPHYLDPSQLRLGDHPLGPYWGARPLASPRPYSSHEDQPDRGGEFGHTTERTESLNWGLPRDFPSTRSLRPPTARPTSPSSRLQRALSYLSRLRFANSYEDSVACAADTVFRDKDSLGSYQKDFLFDLSTLPRPAKTSWLIPGAVLSGSQHATTASNLPAALSPTSPTVDPRSLTSSRNYQSLEDSRTWTRTLGSMPPPPTSNQRDSSEPSQPSQHDRWPVKVTLHTVDFDTMTLSATMEAYNVPSHPPMHYNINPSSNDLYPLRNHFSASSAPNQGLSYPRSNPSSSHPYPSHPRIPHATRTSSITTYLEGEILDFTTHTLVTESFKSSVSNDVIYWRNLPPFAHQSDEELIRALVSRQFLTSLANDWVLMRWKERCFVKRRRCDGPDSAGETDSTTSTSNRTATLSSTARTTSTTSLLAMNNNSTAQTQRRPPSSAPASDADRKDDDDDAPQNPDSNTTNNTNSVEDEELDGCGLTISGFYYVALRRADGAIEGLYCDPQSSPYQHLRLSSASASGSSAFPSWEFR